MGENPIVLQLTQKQKMYSVKFITLVLSMVALSHGKAVQQQCNSCCPTPTPPDEDAITRDKLSEHLGMLDDALAEGSCDEVEDNSSEPSSSTGARQVGRGVAGSSLPGPGFEQDQGESDSVVPTTPKLPLPRRQNDGFAEAVSSPQVPSSDRFVFGSGQASSGLDVIVTSSNSGLPGQEGLDRTAVDIQQFASGGSAAVQQESVEEGDGAEDSEEGGVSSIVSSTEQPGGQSRPARA